MNELVGELRSQGIIDPFQILGEAEKRNVNFTSEDVRQLFSSSIRFRQFVPSGQITQLVSSLSQFYGVKKILDTNCGLGSILSKLDDSIEKTGIEIDDRVAQIAKSLNPKVKIESGSYTSILVPEEYDCIVAMPPFGMRMEVGGRREPTEKVYLEKALSEVSSNGVVIAILPNNLLVLNAFENLREEIITNNSLEICIELPSGAFPGTYIQTSILVIKKHPPTPASKVFMPALTDYDNPNELISDFKNRIGNFWVERSRLNNRLDRHFFSPVYDALVEQLENTETKELQELAEIVRGVPVTTSERRAAGKYLVFKVKNIKNGGLTRYDDDKYIDSVKNSRFEQAILLEDDVIISAVFNDPKVYVYKKSDPPAVITDMLVIIRSRIGKYIATYLQTKEGREIFEKQVDRKRFGNIISRISVNDLKRIRIPILPLADLNSVSIQEINKNSKAENDELLSTISGLEQSQVNQQTLNLLREIKEVVLRVEIKIDKVIEMVRDLQVDFEIIKKEEREDEQKLMLLYSKLDRKLNTIKNELSEELEDYKDIAASLIDNWDKLDDLSKELLPLAEYLYSRLQEIPDVDFSPVILQFCKTIENELLKKMFIAFTLDLLSKYGDIHEFLKDDLNRMVDGEPDKTQLFAKTILNAKGKPIEDIKFTFGQMQFILGLCNSSQTVQRSPLMRGLVEFIEAHFDTKVFLSKEFINELKEINDNFRNRCAHPYKLLISDAKECKQKIPGDINTIVDSIIM